MADTNFDPSLFIGMSSDPTLDVEPAPEPDPAPGPTPEPEDDDDAPEPAPEPEPSDEPEIEPVTFEALTPRERALMARLERVTGEHLAGVGATPTPTPEPVAPTTPEEHNFLAGLNLDDVLATPENLNRVLASVHARAVEQGSRLAAENILRNLPQVIMQYVTQHASMTQLVDQFYRDNPELVEMKKTVAAAANEVAAENPGLSVQEVFNGAAERVYKMMGLKRAAQTRQRTSRPATPRGTTNTGGRVPVPAIQGLAAEVSEFFNIH